MFCQRSLRVLTRWIVSAGRVKKETILCKGDSLMAMKVILCGYHWAGCRAMVELLDQATDLFVYTHASPPCVPDLREACRVAGAAHSLDDISQSSLPFQPDVIASVYYRNILSPGVLAQAGGRAFNLHPSLLPKYRGCSSLAWAMIHGEEYAGYTYHYIDQGIDTGDVLLQRRMPIYPWDTGFSLYYRVMFRAMEDFSGVLKMVVAGLPGRPQEGVSSYYRRGCPFDAQIQDEWSEEVISRFIRALVFPPLPPAQYRGRSIHSLAEYKTLRNELQRRPT